MLVNEITSILLKSAETGLKMQARDGSMPAGHNGPYNDPETPVRNTAHWAMIFIKAFQITKKGIFLISARKCLKYLKKRISKKNIVFECRDKIGKDRTNGLIGQAWALEPFAAIQSIDQDKELIEIAISVINAHFFDYRKGLWKISNLAGDSERYDNTFNHQLWFASVASYFKDHSSEIASKTEIFMSKLHKNLWLRSNGRIRQTLYTDFRESYLKPLVKNVIRKREQYYMKLKEVGYHAFNTHAFVILNLNYPDHKFWCSQKFRNLLNYMLTSEYQELIFKSRYGFPYNSPAYEVLSTKKHFDDLFPINEEFVRELWDYQIVSSWDEKNLLMSEGTFDRETNCARVYECGLCLYPH